MCSDRDKNLGCRQKKKEGTSSAIFGVRTAAEMLQTQAICRRSSQQEYHDKDEVEGNFRNLNFSPSTKKTTEYSFERFLPIKRY